MVSHLYFLRLRGVAPSLSQRAYILPNCESGSNLLLSVLFGVNTRQYWPPAVVFETTTARFRAPWSAVFGQNLGCCRRNPRPLLPVRLRLDRRGQSRHLNAMAPSLACSFPPCVDAAAELSHIESGSLSDVQLRESEAFHPMSDRIVRLNRTRKREGQPLCPGRFLAWPISSFPRPPVP
jgi:hypothetical protein